MTGEDDYKTLYLQMLAADRAKDERLALLAHEFRNPLNALQASAEVLSRAAPDSREAVSAREIIGRQVGKLARLIDLRLSRGPAVSRAATGAAPGAAGPSERPTRMIAIGLIAEDPAALRALLDLGGNDVSMAVDGPAAIAMLLRDAPAVAIVALGVTGFDGLDLALRSRAAGYTGRLISLAAGDVPGDAERSLAAGFEAHLAQPVDRERLARLLAA